MKKKILSDEELNRVLRLKQAGVSWLKIQHQSGIPRRIAKRAYEDWQRAQSFAELKESRRAVAAEAFREHVESLIKLGTFLAMHLDIPRTMPTETPGGAQILDSLWQLNVLGESQDQPLRGVSGIGAERERRSITRQHQMLFQSLQDHTRGELRWEVLKEWESAWDNSRQLYTDLQKEATVVVRNFLNQEQGLEKKIKNGNRRGDAITQIVETLLRRIWSGILDDKLDLQQDVFEVIAGPGGVAFVAVTGIGNSNFLTYNDKNLAEKAARLGNQAAKNLLLGENEDLIEKSLKGCIDAMRRATEDLADMLNPLVLRPIILRTRCELCPA
jgi:hypothetical protein